jgi:hypothetical protein
MSPELISSLDKKSPAMGIQVADIILSLKKALGLITTVNSCVSSKST